MLLTSLTAVFRELFESRALCDEASNQPVNHLHFAIHRGIECFAKSRRTGHSQVQEAPKLAKREPDFAALAQIAKSDESLLRITAPARPGSARARQQTDALIVAHGIDCYPGLLGQLPNSPKSHVKSPLLKAGVWSRSTIVSIRKFSPAIRKYYELILNYSRVEIESDGIGTRVCTRSS